MKIALSHVKHLILDADGVLWHGETAMPALPTFFSRLNEAGIGTVIATNNSTKTVTSYVQKLAKFGVEMAAERIITSAVATATYLADQYPAGTPIFVVGEAGLKETLVESGFAIVDGYEIGMPATLVVVGLCRQISYELLANACLHISGGARFVATNPDATYPTERGELPGAGAILAAIERATGKPPDIIIGKPHSFMFQEALRRLGGSRQNTAMVGDRLSTDILGGVNAGIPTILLLSGISQSAELQLSTIQPDYLFNDIFALCDQLVSD